MERSATQTFAVVIIGQNAPNRNLAIITDQKSSARPIKIEVIIIVTKHAKIIGLRPYRSEIFPAGIAVSNLPKKNIPNIGLA